MSNEQNNQRQGAPYPDYHPLIDGRRAGYGDEEIATCDDCGRPFLAAEAGYSRYTGAPICPPCLALQVAEGKE
jgi:hypothetical protein